MGYFSGILVVTEPLTALLNRMFLNAKGNLDLEAFISRDATIVV